jgi:type II secretory pathway pseudopilin PulG
MRGERGETLLELVIAVMIMGVAMVAIVGGLAVSIRMSDIHRKQATAGTAARDYAEALETSVAKGGYVDACHSTTPYTTVYTVPSGYSSAVAVQYWTGSAWTSSCTTDIGLQQVTVTVTSSDQRAAETVTVVLRKPCRLSDPVCS